MTRARAANSLRHAAAFARGLPIGEPCAGAADESARHTIFGTCSGGVKASRDEVSYDFDAAALAARVGAFIERFNAEVDRFNRSGGGGTSADELVKDDGINRSRRLKEEVARGRHAAFAREKVRACLYRPFGTRFLYFDRMLDEEVYRFEWIAPTPLAHAENPLVVLTSPGSDKAFAAIAARGIADVHAVGAGATSQCFPFYVFNEDGTNRRENITDWALDQFRAHYGDPVISKWSIFDYVYGVLHHPGYRATFADKLKHELPRIPLAPDFRAFQQAGQKLLELHLNYEKLEPWPLTFVEKPDVPRSARVAKMKLRKDKSAVVVNDSLTLAGIPPEVFEYRVGNRSALDWVIDQHRVSTDKRSGITSDPNRPDDPQYIVRLVGQVVRVSAETVTIVNALPSALAETESASGAESDLAPPLAAGVTRRKRRG